MWKTKSSGKFAVEQVDFEKHVNLDYDFVKTSKTSYFYVTIAWFIN